jgi:hypothetical protein
MYLALQIFSVRHILSLTILDICHMHVDVCLCLRLEKENKSKQAYVMAYTFFLVSYGSLITFLPNCDIPTHFFSIYSDIVVRLFFVL